MSAPLRLQRIAVPDLADGDDDALDQAEPDFCLDGRCLTCLRYLPAAGRCVCEDKGFMSVTTGPVVAMGAPKRGDGLPTVAPLPAPKILVRRTKTAGWQVVYVAQSHRVTVLRRRCSLLEANTIGAARARVQGVPLEVDQ